MFLKNKKFQTFLFSVIVIVIKNIEVTSCFALYTCKDFKDTRFSDNINEEYNLTIIVNSEYVTIPTHLMSNNKNETFGLIKLPKPLRCHTEKILKQNLTLDLFKAVDNVVLQNLALNSNVSSSTAKPLKISKRNDGKLEKHLRFRGKIGPHFTPEGYLEYDHFLYSKEQFCVSKITTEVIEVEICPVNCGQDGNVCLPKCCGIDEVMVYWKWTCQKVNDPWKPYLYKNVYNKIDEDERRKLEIHFSRPFLNCTFLDPIPFSEVKKPVMAKNQDSHKRNIIRLLKDGRVMQLDEDRHWKQMLGHGAKYCIDAMLTYGPGGNGSYIRDEAHQMLMLCSVTDETTNSVNVEQQIDDAYAGVLFVASIFIFLTALIHAVLYDRQQMHGLLILSQSISLLFFYILHGTAYIVAQRRKKVEDRRSAKCLTIAILSHFFFLTTFSWLSVVNFDLWLTFRSLRPISKMSGRMRRFRLYSFIGWGIPFLLMIAFVTLDFYFRDIETEVIVPDYAVTTCYVASWSRRQYICSVLTVAIFINLVLIISTFKIFYDFKHGKTGIVMPKRAKGDKYSFKLFLKLFLVMGSVWIFDGVFCYIYNTGEQSPWYITLVDYAMFLQAIAIFIILCCNRRVLKQLEDKFPRFSRIFRPFKKLLKIPESATDNGLTDTSPATPANSRKMSTTSVVSMTNDGTMERRAV